MPQCKHCQSLFEITNQDRELLEKLSPVFAGKRYPLPAPTLCPDCRQQRRLTYRNERNLYKRKCDLTGKDMVSIYSPDKKCIVYDQKVRRTDQRNPLEYGQDFDFSRSFFEQFDELSLKTPRPSLINWNSENSEYTNHSCYNKDCYMCLNTGYSDNSIYCSNYSIYNKNCLDCLDIHYCENCYFCTDVKKSNDCKYLYSCTNCYKCSFCNDCDGCNNCFMCHNLRNKSFCIENKQYSKDEYNRIIIEKRITDDKMKLLYDVLNKSLHKNLVIEQSENCSGDHIYNSKNTQNSYYVFDMHDCAYCYDAGELKNSMDAYEPFTGENHYETHACNLDYTIMACSKCYENSNIYYSQYCRYCKDCFGCFGLRNKQYCIFNKQYTKADYETLVPQIIEHMTKKGEWGEFFPASISTFGYNETAANEYYPLTKAEAIKQGFNRSDYEAPFPKTDAQDVIICEITGKPFRLVPQEIEFYQKHNLPIPTKHPDIRHMERMKLRSLRKLRDRKCDKCGIEMKTTYAPERKEIVYCESCYNKEIYG